MSLILGGVAVNFLAADETVWWFYPIGLCVGFAIYQAIVMSILRRRPVMGDAKAQKIVSGGARGELRYLRRPFGITRPKIGREYTDDDPGI